MYDIPSRKDVRECIITPGVLANHEDPLLVYKREDYEEDAGDSDKTVSA
jgi:hypothetical protein